VCNRGLAPTERQIGIGARSVAPELYIVCAASGSSAHLGAISSDAEIVAIDIDPEAPIFRAASYGIVGDLADILPDLIAAIRKHNPVAATS
jgi:electron transfer flavoprotein alpha subunit